MYIGKLYITYTCIYTYIHHIYIIYAYMRIGREGSLRSERWSGSYRRTQVPRRESRRRGLEQVKVEKVKLPYLAHGRAHTHTHTDKHTHTHTPGGRRHLFWNRKLERKDLHLSAPHPNVTERLAIEGHTKHMLL
jgi:hypothetical protein